MPELPEVETIRKQLISYLPVKITRITYSSHVNSILKTRMFSPLNKTIADIERKGKLLNFVFSDNTHMLSGLGMSGGWRISPSMVREKHTHMQFTCHGQRGRIYLAYVDPRRFGNCHFADQATAASILARLGTDVGSPSFTASYVTTICRAHPGREIKPLLLDQSCFAGVGNYIACEVLAHARIHPTKLAGTLTPQHHRQIVAAMKLVLSGSLKTNGLTFSGGYIDANGNSGNALNTLVVFHQKTCGLCHRSDVVKITLKGRGTYFCPRCQT
jgi:formamidopyrimidine-DNA glycosylase